MHPTINVHQILNTPIEVLWNNLYGPCNIEFDDGILENCNEKDVFFSYYFWEFFKLYPLTPILMKHCVKSVIKDTIDTSTCGKLLENTLFDIYDVYSNINPDKVALMEQLAKKGYQIINTLYNDLTLKTERYVTSLDILDLIELVQDKRLTEEKDKLTSELMHLQATDISILHREVTHQYFEDGISRCYTIIDEMLKDPKYKNNSAIKAANAKVIKIQQLKQSIGPRGFITDIDSIHFPKPVLRSYTEGFRSLADIMMESRSAAKALVYQTDPLQKSEYFSRRQQLICMNLVNLHRCDCGSNHYLIFNLQKEDLDNFAGKFYLDETTNTLQIIKASDKHLINKTLKIRTLIDGCQIKDPNGVCETCFGELSLGILKNFNLGHTNCVTLTYIISQVVISTKHHDGSASMEGILLSPEHKKYFNTPHGSNAYYINQSVLKSNKVELIIEHKQAYGLADVHLVNSVNQLSISRVSDIEYIDLAITNKKNEKTVIRLPVCIKQSNASLTHTALEYIKKNGWEVANNNNYSIDITDWDCTKPLLTLPLKQINMSDHQAEIAEMLESTVKDLLKRDTEIDPKNLLIEFYILVNKRIKMNIAVLEAILYCSMVISAKNDDYGLPKTFTENGLGIKQTLLTNRSFGGYCGYERHLDYFLNPHSYQNNNRMDHPFDVLLCPEEVVKYNNILHIN